MRRLNSFITTLPFPAALLLLLLLRTPRIEASVHGYAGEIFVAKGNAFVFHAGSEGIYSSISEFNESLPSGSFIRFENIVFRRPLELSNFSSGTIHTIVFKVDARETIGGFCLWRSKSCVLHSRSCKTWSLYRRPNHSSTIDK